MRQPQRLTIDPKGRLYSVCDNHLMIVSDPAAGKVLATPAIGGGPDGVAFDDGYALSANGQDGTITMVGDVGGKFEPVATIQTSAAREPSPRTKSSQIVPASGRVRSSRAGERWKKGRPQAIPDSFQIVVVGR